MRASITLPIEEYDEMKKAGAKEYSRGYEAGLDTARKDFAEVNAHKNELLRCVELLEGQLAEARAKNSADPSRQTNLVGPQDISTAPRMTDVLVWWPIVKLDDDGEPTDEVVDGQWLISEDQGNYWIEPDVMNAIGDHLGDDFTYAAQPTQWMPLPAPLFVATEGQADA